MITEDYVSFETAKLLKEKGFDVYVRSFYEKDVYRTKEEFSTNNALWNWNISGFRYSAPTLQMAMKWLEVMHHILVVADYEYECDSTPWYYKIYRLGEHGKPERVTVKGVSYDKDDNPTEHIVGYRDYERSHKDYINREKATEGGIKDCLENLI